MVLEKENKDIDMQSDKIELDANKQSDIVEEKKEDEETIKLTDKLSKVEETLSEDENDTTESVVTTKPQNNKIKETKKGKRSRSNELKLHETKKKKDFEPSDSEEETFDINTTENDKSDKEVHYKDYVDDEIDGIYERLTEETKRMLFKEIIRIDPTWIAVWYRLSDSESNLRESISNKIKSFEKRIYDATQVDYG